MNMIDVSNIQKSFGSLNVLNGISFSLKKGETIAVIGPSGSGKSTMLRCLIELERINSGDIIIEGEHLCKNGVYPHDKIIKPILLKMGMVFQQFNLFPNMSVRENLLCAPKALKKYSIDEMNKKCIQCLKDVGLENKIDNKPGTLSGGQKQRVAIARALMMNPDILLFDEPTSALDPELTGEVLSVIKNLAKQNRTMMIVTHEIGFAKEAAHKILFMDNGVIVEEGSPDKVILEPQNERLKTFLQKVYV